MRACCYLPCPLVIADFSHVAFVARMLVNACCPEPETVGGIISSWSAATAPQVTTPLEARASSSHGSAAWAASDAPGLRACFALLFCALCDVALPPGRAAVGRWRAEIENQGPSRADQRGRGVYDHHTAELRVQRARGAWAAARADAVRYAAYSAAAGGGSSTQQVPVTVTYRSPWEAMQSPPQKCYVIEGQRASFSLTARTVWVEVKGGS
jgi:hypothetical protein